MVKACLHWVSAWVLWSAPVDRLHELDQTMQRAFKEQSMTAEFGQGLILLPLLAEELKKSKNAKDVLGWVDLNRKPDGPVYETLQHLKRKYVK